MYAYIYILSDQCHYAMFRIIKCKALYDICSAEDKI